MGNRIQRERMQDRMAFSTHFLNRVNDPQYQRGPYECQDVPASCQATRTESKSTVDSRIYTANQAPAAQAPPDPFGKPGQKNKKKTNKNKKQPQRKAKKG